MTKPKPRGVSIDKIIVTISGRQIFLTPEDARELHDKLGELLGLAGARWYGEPMSPFVIPSVPIPREGPSDTPAPGDYPIAAYYGCQVVPGTAFDPTAPPTFTTTTTKITDGSDGEGK